MDQQEKTFVASVTLNVYEHEIQGKSLYSYVIQLPDGTELTHEFLYANAKEAITKANGRLYVWLKNRK